MVIVLDKHKKPLGTTTERRARKLMEKRRACVYRYAPFTVIVKDVDIRNCKDVPSYEIKVDPGSKTTGVAILNKYTKDIEFAKQIQHRAGQVKDNLETRRNARRNRRSRETLYRHPRFKKGDAPTSRPEGWLPPSMRSIVGNVDTWVKRLSKLFNIESAAVEAVRFDTQLLDNPDIEGIQYQQGTLMGTEIREYLLDRYQHECQYCHGESGDPALEWEHKLPKRRGGSNSVSNATIACHACNQEKGARTPKEWLADLQAKPNRTMLDQVRIAGIQNVIAGKDKKSNRYCAWVGSTRKHIEKVLFDRFGSNVVCSTGGQTKFNRKRFGLPKDHQYDAWCVGPMKSIGKDLTHGYYLTAKGTGRGTHFRGKINKCGIITQKLKPRAKRVFGFMNGDFIIADVPHKTSGRPYKYEGRFAGRVMVRASGSFDIRTIKGNLVTVSHRFCTLKQYADGYIYKPSRTRAIPLGH